jgi:glutaryl-CoA dehydrogenase
VARAWRSRRYNGILLENHIRRFVADAEAIYSYEGTREMSTLIVGKAIT